MRPTAKSGERSEAKEDRRQALVRAAYNQIAQQGFEGLRTREVADEVGCNIATLHYYFPTKEALIRGVVELAMQRFRSTLPGGISPGDQLANHLRAVRDLLHDEPQLGIVMCELALRSARDPQIAEIILATNETWHRALRGLLSAAVSHGRLRPELDSDGAASLIVAVMTGMTLPTMSSGTYADEALQQLERWLGVGRASS